MLKYLYNPGSANLPPAEPCAAVMICWSGKGGWKPGTGPLDTSTRNARTWICLSQALDDMPSSKVTPSLSSSVPNDMVQGFSGWAVEKLTGVLGYLSSATSLVLCLEPTAVVRFDLGPTCSCLCAARGAAPARRCSMTTEFSTPKTPDSFFHKDLGKWLGIDRRIEVCRKPRITTRFV